ncbi:MAG: SAM-dependent methyltransferase [Tissierellia bacterium]|nr:SAM-dependent methyltransferase [Tissierellia bacterium]
MNRLERIKSMVDPCQTAADIGTDHGYVAEMLLKEGICKQIIATDLNEGPLNRAIEHLTKSNLHDKCNFRLGCGLRVLNEGEADAIIIAGMGGDLISDIIHTSKDIALKAQQLILQPMTAVNTLRKYLYENGFEIIDESIVKEYHHFYFIIKAKKGIAKQMDNIYFEISNILIEKKDPLMIDYLNKVLNTNEKIISSLEKTKNVEYNEKIESLKDKNNKIKELIR